MLIETNKSEGVIGGRNLCISSSSYLHAYMLKTYHLILNKLYSTNSNLPIAATGKASEMKFLKIPIIYNVKSEVGSWNWK